MFPIAGLLKKEVREIAKAEGLLTVANKKDSTGICFIGKNKFQDFIEEVSTYIYIYIPEYIKCNCSFEIMQFLL